MEAGLLGLGVLEESQPGPGVLGGVLDDVGELFFAVQDEESRLHLQAVLLGQLKGLGLTGLDVVAGLLEANPAVLTDLLKKGFDD